MKIIKYIELYNFLMYNCKMLPWEAIRTIGKVRKMSSKLVSALWDVMNNHDLIPDVEVGDVSLAELVNDEGMAPVEAILMLDWIERDSLAALTYMESERMRKPVDRLNEEETEIVHRAIENLCQEGITIHLGEIPGSSEQLNDDVKCDIIANDDSTSKPDEDE